MVERHTCGECGPRVDAEDYDALAAENARLNEMVDDGNHWEGVAASYRMERDALAADLCSADVLLQGRNERIAALEATMREIADFAEQFIGDDEDGDERMYKVHQIADNAIPFTPETPEEICGNCGAYKRGDVHICNHPGNAYPVETAGDVSNGHTQTTESGAVTENHYQHWTPPPKMSYHSEEVERALRQVPPAASGTVDTAKLEEFKAIEPLYSQAAEFALSEPTMSISKMQRKFTLGYNRAVRLCERLAEDGILIFNNVAGGWRRAASAPKQPAETK